MPSTKIDGQSFVNDINGGVFLTLVDILNDNNTWKALMSIIPCDWYTVTDVQRFERASLRYGDSPARALLSDLGDRLTVCELTSYLEELQLGRALMLLKPYEPVRIITSPPGVVEVLRGCTSHLRLQFVASGFPWPSFQWFKKPSNNDVLEELLLQNQNMLDLTPMRKSDEGMYICKVYNQNPDNVDEESAQWTSWVMVTTLENPGEDDDDLPDVPEIIEQPKVPKIDYMSTRASFTLQCKAKSYWPVTYEWYGNGIKLEGENSCVLHIDSFNVDKASEWTYQCRVFNRLGSILSHPVFLKGNGTNVDLDDDVVEDKVALLIANQSYNNLGSLRLAVEDVKILALLLEKLGFKVITLIDLTKEEIESALEDFSRLLADGVIGAFYYVGHGFEKEKCCYMLPVDAPHDFRRRDSVSSEFVVSVMQRHDLALCLVILDTCRREPNWNMTVSRETTPLFQSTVRRNLVYAYSTSHTCSAYEGKNDTNGIFMKYLKKYIGQHIPIQEVFFNVSRDVAMDPVASKKQYPWLETGLAKKLSLAARIKPSLPSSSSRNLLFRLLTELPKQKMIDCQNRKVLVEFKRFHGVICNAMIVTIKADTDANEYSWRLRALNKEVHVEIDETSGDQYTVYCIQKLQDPLILEVQINDAIWQENVEFPLISKGRLLRC